MSFNSGYPKNDLQVTVTNEIAINLYQKLGFKITEKLENYYNYAKPPDNDAYLMILEKSNVIVEINDEQFEELIKKLDDINF